MYVVLESGRSQRDTQCITVLYMRRKLNGVLLVLAALSNIASEEVSMFKLQELTKIKNYNTLSRAVNILKELGLVRERYDEGPPMRRFISLTEKGRRAAEYARKLLEVVGEV